MSASSSRETDRHADDGADAAAVSDLYPDRLLPIAGQHQLLSEATELQRDDLAERYEAFSVRREDLLLDYGYNTARAYWGDLDDLFWWAQRRQLDVYALTDRQFNQYLGLLRRRRYSENTIRRRGTTFRKWRQSLPSQNDF